MDEHRPDCVVIGAGIIGSSAAWQLADAGLRVVCVERWGAGHSRGSSHGATRGLRYSYEDPAYARLAMEAETWWRVAERRSGTTLLRMTGGVDFGRPGTRSFDATVRTCRDLGLEHRVLPAGEIHRLHPCFEIPSDCAALVQSGAGLIDAALAGSTIRALATESGARFVWNTFVERVTREDGGWCVHLPSSILRSPRIVIACGPWTGQFLDRSPDLAPSVRLPIEVIQCEPIYVESSERVELGPLFYVHADDAGSAGVYAQPQPDEATGATGSARIKVGRHGGVSVSDPDRPHPVPVEDHEELIARLAAVVPAFGSGRVVATDTCYYSMTPDESFIVDTIRDGAVLAAGFSGHGFKFAPVLGRAICELLLDGATGYEIEGMRMSRVPHRPILEP